MNLPIFIEQIIAKFITVCTRIVKHFNYSPIWTCIHIRPYTSTFQSNTNNIKKFYE